MPERYDHYNIQSRGCEISRDLAVGLAIAKWIEAQDKPSSVPEDEPWSNGDRHKPLYHNDLTLPVKRYIPCLLCQCHGYLFPGYVGPVFFGYEGIIYDVDKCLSNWTQPSHVSARATQWTATEAHIQQIYDRRKYVKQMWRDTSRLSLFKHWSDENSTQSNNMFKQKNHLNDTCGWNQTVYLRSKHNHETSLSCYLLLLTIDTYLISLKCHIQAATFYHLDFY